jgi:hypothetical protein
MARRNNYRSKLTSHDRAQFARERKALVGSLLTQKGFEAYLVVEHIRGSQYLIRKPDGEQIYMSHKKPRFAKADSSTSITKAGWSLWEDRN